MLLKGRWCVFGYLPTSRQVATFYMSLEYKPVWQKHTYTGMDMGAQLKEVFGVSRHPVLSYVERPHVDEALDAALKDTRQIVIYGSSKQGKTALLERHIPQNMRTTVHCGPSMSAGDLYRSILRQNDIEIVTETVAEASAETSLSVAAKFRAILPWVGGAEADTSGGLKAGVVRSEKAAPIEFNLAVAQDIGELLKKRPEQRHYYVLENFHYLSDEVQNQLAFDLRTFEEMGVRFVVLGVWRERNRLIQYNGDLQDRISEVPVEPWEERDFRRVVERGLQS